MGQERTCLMKKKMDNILKGVAGAGAALGGASAFSANDVVYAAEIEQREEELEELEEQTSEVVASSESLIAEDSFATSEYSTTEMASYSLKARAIVSVSDSISTALSESAAIAASEYASASEVASEALADYEASLEEFENNDYSDPYLEKLIGEINAQRKIVEETKKAVLENKDSIQNYYRKADKLANLLIQYSFYQEGYVGEIQYSNWDSDDYTTNSVRVTYTDAGSEYHICLTDGSYGISDTKEGDVDKNDVTAENKACTTPTGYTKVTVS